MYIQIPIFTINLPMTISLAYSESGTVDGGVYKAIESFCTPCPSDQERNKFDVYQLL